MTRFIRKAYYFCFDGRTVTRSNADNISRIHRGAGKIFSDYFMRFFVRIRYPAICGVFADAFVFKAHRFNGVVAVLNFKCGKINAFSVYSCGCSRFEPTQRKSERNKAFLKFGRRVHSVGAALIVYVSDKDSAPEKRARCNDGGADFVNGTETGLDLRNFSVFRSYPDYLVLFYIKSVLRFKRFFHQNTVSCSVRLHAERMNSGSFSSVQHSALKKNFVRRLCHLPAESVYFTHKVSFCRAAYRRIARHISDGVEVYCEHNRFQTEPCAGESRLYTRVSSSDNGAVVHAADIFFHLFSSVFFQNHPVRVYIISY